MMCARGLCVPLQLVVVFLVGWCALNPVCALRIKHLHEHKQTQHAQAHAHQHMQAQAQTQTQAVFSRTLDIYQGFNFKKDKTGAVGFITSVNINGIPISADFSSLTNPLQPGSTIKLPAQVAVLNHILWETGPTDAIYLSGQISATAKQTISQMLFSTWSGGIPVTFTYTVYEYDPLQKIYFRSNWVDQTLFGLLEFNGDEYNLAVSDASATEVLSPQNYAFTIGIKPQTQEQAINLATGVGKNLVKQWGVTEA